MDFDSTPVVISDATALLAAKAVALLEPDHEDAQELLKALGLWDRVLELRREAKAS